VLALEEFFVKVDETNTFFNSNVTRKFVYNYIIFYQKILVGALSPSFSKSWLDVSVRPPWNSVLLLPHRYFIFQSNRTTYYGSFHENMTI